MLLNPVPVIKLVSLEPSVFKRIILFSVIPLKEVNEPPKIILPSFCNAIVLGAILNPVPVIKLESFVPSRFKRIILFSVIPL